MRAVRRLVVLLRKLLVAPALPREGWLRLDRALVCVGYDADRPRPYSTLYRPRLIAGDVDRDLARDDHDES